MYIYIKKFLAGFALIALWHPLMAAVDFEDDFESGDLSTIMNGFEWERDVRVAVVSDGPKHHSGSGSGHSLRFTFVAGAPSDDAWSELRFQLGDNMTDVYMEFYIYYPDGEDGFGARYQHRNYHGDNNKFLRLWNNKANTRSNHVRVGFSTISGQPDLISSFFSEHSVDGQGTGRRGSAFSRTHGIGNDELGRWIRINIRISVDKGEGGIMQFWRNGRLLMNNTISNIPEDMSRNFFSHGYLLGWANSGFSERTYIFIDDFKISDKPFGRGFDVKAPPNPPTSIEVISTSN